MKRLLIVVLELGTVLLSVSSSAQGGMFPGERFRFEKWPREVALADLDGDAIPDVVTTIYGSHEVGVRLGTGFGGFRELMRYATGRGPSGLALGDLDGDGALDLVVENESSRDISVLLGHGDGTFGPERRVDVGSQLSCIGVADLDGDGLPDVVGSRPYDAVRILFGAGGGDLAPVADLASSGVACVRVADLDSDGNLDLLTMEYVPDEITAWLGNGDGSFRPQQSVAVDPQPRVVEISDLDGDGFPDVVLEHSGAYAGMSVLMSTGDGSFAQVGTIELGRSLTSVHAKDLNGDGHPDLAVATPTRTSSGRSPEVIVLLGHGDGSFGDPRRFHSVAPSELAIDDLDGDGDADLAVVSNTTGDVSVFLGDGLGGFDDGVTHTPVLTMPDALAVGRLDGDDIPDLAVVGHIPYAIRLLLGDGGGGFSLPHSVPAANLDSAVQIADFDADSIDDLLVEGVHVRVLPGNGDGTYREASQTFPGGEGSAVADLDGDGVLDIVTLDRLSFSQEYVLSVLMGSGDGSFQQLDPVAIGEGRFLLSIGDFTGDGIPDVLLASVERRDVHILRGFGDGTFESENLTPLEDVPSCLGLGDLDADGRLDVAVGTLLQPGVRILAGAGGGALELADHYASAGHPVSLAIEDLDRDGVLDLAVLDSIGVSVRFGAGGGTFGAPAFFGAGEEPAMLIASDLDGDSLPDLVAANRRSQDVTTLINRMQIVTVTLPARIHLWGNALIPVFILGSEAFPAEDIDTRTLTFGPAGALPAHEAGGHLEDVDDDGIDDLVSHFAAVESGLPAGKVRACIQGRTIQGVPFRGCGDVLVRLPGCGLGFELVLLAPVLWGLGRRGAATTRSRSRR